MKFRVVAIAVPSSFHSQHFTRAGIGSTRHEKKISDATERRGRADDRSIRKRVTTQGYDAEREIRYKCDFLLALCLRWLCPTYSLSPSCEMIRVVKEHVVSPFAQTQERVVERRDVADPLTKLTELTELTELTKNTREEKQSKGLSLSLARFLRARARTSTYQAVLNCRVTSPSIYI